MHWLAAQVDRLRTLQDRYRAVRSEGARADTSIPGRPREALREGIEELVAGPAAFAAHQGLLLAATGNGVDHDALAAMAQACTTPAEAAAGALGMGEVSQVLVVGSQHKLAILRVGDMLVGMYSPQHVVLSESTSR